MNHAKIAGLPNSEPEKSVEEMMIAIGHNLSDLESSEDGEDGEDEDDAQPEQGKLSEDDKPGWGMGTTPKTVEQCMERFRQKQMKLDELTQPRWKDAADYFHERDRKYGTLELQVLAVVQPHTDYEAVAPAPTTSGELLESHQIVPGISQMPQRTSRPRTGHIRLGSMKQQSSTSICGLESATDCDTSSSLKAKPVEPVSVYPGM